MDETGNMPRELVLLSQARMAIEESRSIHEIKDIRDKAEAIRLYAKQSGDGLEVQNAAAEVKIRAERRAGELLKQMADAGERSGGRGGDRKSSDAVSLDSLSDIGVTRKQSSRWQREASVLEEDFERHVEDFKSNGRELTSKSVIKLAHRQPATPDTIDVSFDGQTRIVSSLDELNGEEFGTIYADPPWQYGNQATRASTDNHYDTMTVDALCELPVGQLAADKSHLHLWTTSGFLFDAARIIEAWGFTYKSHFVWVKPQMGIGNYWRLSHEILLLGVRGGLRFNDKSLRSWGEFDRASHSEKPEAIRGMIERASRGPYLELFGRKRVVGWTVFGNQISPQAMLA